MSQPVALAAAALLAAAGAGAAPASPPARSLPPAPGDSAVRFLRPLRAGGERDPAVLFQRLRPSDIASVRVGPEAPIARSPWEPLNPEQQRILAEAVALREQGLHDLARRRALQLLAALPHHPLALTELARIENLRGDFGAVERLARAERLAGRDSLLLARELSHALERLGRVREAAQPAIEAWAASPQSWWAEETLERLAPAASRAIRDLLRAATLRLPGRTDMALLLARLDWRSGDGPQALRTLAAADDPTRRPPLRWTFAEDLLSHQLGRDSTGAAEAFLGIAADNRIDPVFRIQAAQRAWPVLTGRRAEVAAAPRLAQALEDIAVERWNPDFLVDLARALRRGGRTAESRSLLGRGGRQIDPATLALEQALDDLRDGPPERALPRLADAAGGSAEAAYRYAEALFFAGLPDSALSWYERVSKDPGGAWTGAALERMFLIEDARPHDALIPLGLGAWEEWRGDLRRATTLTDSLYSALPRGPLWAYAALRLSALRDAAGDARAALVPLLAVADSLPGDRLAPLARQRAGDLCLEKLQDERRALALYEECLARYPRAWNAPEVRRKLETLRRERRF